MSRTFLLVSLVLLTGLLTLLFLRQQRLLETPSQAVVESQPVPRHPIGSPILYPVPAVEKKELPPLGESDSAVRTRLAALFDPWEFGDLLFSDQFIRRLVVTIDNLPRKEVPQRYLPLRRPAGALAVSGRGQGLAIGPENHQRYLPYVRLAVKMDADRVVDLYVRFYPLFQAAYEELGYPNAYFNDRLVAVIDHLLTSPEITGPVPLVQPVVIYKYADPELESLSAGQKLMIRIGPENAARIKTKLREFRQALAALTQERQAEALQLSPSP